MSPCGVVRVWLAAHGLSPQASEHEATSSVSSGNEDLLLAEARGLLMAAPPHSSGLAPDDATIASAAADGADAQRALIESILDTKFLVTKPLADFFARVR